MEDFTAAMDEMHARVDATHSITSRLEATMTAQTSTMRLEIGHIQEALKNHHSSMEDLKNEMTTKLDTKLDNAAWKEANDAVRDILSSLQVDVDAHHDKVDEMVDAMEELTFRSSFLESKGWEIVAAELSLERRAAFWKGRCVSRRVENYARKSCRAFPLEELYRLGRGNSERLHLAQLIHQEMAPTSRDCNSKCAVVQRAFAPPFWFGRDQRNTESRGMLQFVREVVIRIPSSQWFVGPAGIHKAPEADLAGQCRCAANHERSPLGGILRNFDVRSAMGDARFEEIRSEVDFIFDRFFIKRIGLRFLIQHPGLGMLHHIEAAEAAESALLPGASGIIRSLAVGEILRAAAQEARSAVQEEFGLAPQVEVIGDGAELPLVHANTFATGSSLCKSNLNQDFNHFTHVPSHVHFICYQLLRNACHATAERWQGQRLQKQRELLLSVATGAKPQSMPMGRATVAGFPFAARSGVAKSPEGLAPVRAIFAHGSEEVSIKVSDEGGGIPRSELPQAWSYRTDISETSERLRVGLPLSRLHARYYGGDVVLKSMEGFGTDVYVFLNRLGHGCENLPQGVRLSPAQLDSSITKEASIKAESLGDMSEAEVAHLTRRLRERRATSQTQKEIE
eukprot:symbB.v1.2.027845.t2/scaffold2885.1/size67989/3